MPTKQQLRYIVWLPLGIIGTVLIVLAITLVRWSPGTPQLPTDLRGNQLQGGFVEKTFIPVNGTRQGMFIRGTRKSNPVLLFVHGGPGFPEYFLAEKFPSGLEEHFTVCYWEQRGGGLSYDEDAPFESMTLEQLTSDALVVTDYLRRRFGKDRIYLLAHSGGTAFAIQAAAKAPMKYHAYVGMAQVARQAESEKLAYEYLVDQYYHQDDEDILKELARYRPLNSPEEVEQFFLSPVRDRAMHAAGVGTTRQMKSVFRDIFIPVWTCPAYTLKEKMNFWMARFSFAKKTTLPQQVLALDLPRRVPAVDLPVYFLSGKHDMTVNYQLSQNYLDSLRAPVKGFYTFERSAHSPLFEEPERVKEIMVRDVLRGENGMADRIPGR